MTTRIIQLCFCLPLGTATTVAVAWSCATWSQMSEQPEVAFHVMNQDNGWWFSAERFEGFGATRRELGVIWARTDAEGRVVSQSNAIQITKDYFTFRGYLGCANHATFPPPEPPVHRFPIEHTLWSRLGQERHGDSSTSVIIEEGAHGWPMFAMWCSYWTHVTRTDSEQQKSRERTTESLLKIRFDTTDKYLPTRPIVLGFAGDTIFYSSAWWLLLLGIPRARKWNRRRTNRCVQCAYDLRGTSTDRCPECGWKLTRTKAAG